MNSRSAQQLAAALAVLLVVLIGATVFILLSRPSVPPSPTPSLPRSPSTFAPSPSATPSAPATAVAIVSASPSPIATTPPTVALTTPTATSTVPPTPTAEIAGSPTVAPADTLAPTLAPTASPLPTLQATLELSPTPTPAPTPSPTPTLSPTSPERQLRLIGVGLDSAAEGGDARYIEINADGPGTVTVRVANVSGGTVRLCIDRQDRQQGRTCNGRDGSSAARVEVTDTGPSLWLISARGRELDVAPIADLRITFHSLAPAATLRSFRYLGTSDPARNGFTAEVVPAADGTIRVQGNFEENAFTHRVVVAPAGYDVTGSAANTFETNPDPAVTAGTTYRISVSSPDEITNPAGPAFVVATIIWP